MRAELQIDLNYRAYEFVLNRMGENFIRRVMQNSHEKAVEEILFPNKTQRKRVEDDNLQLVIDRLKYSRLKSDKKQALIDQAMSMAQMPVVKGDSEHTALSEKAAMQFLELITIAEIQTPAQNRSMGDYNRELKQLDQQIQNRIRQNEKRAELQEALKNAWSAARKNTESTQSNRTDKQALQEKNAAPAQISSADKDLQTYNTKPAIKHEIDLSA